MIPLTTEPDHSQIDFRARIAGRRCVVIGSAPLDTPRAIVAPDECVICVNGSVFSYDGISDLWLLTSKPPDHDRPRQYEGRKRMLRQSRGKTARHVAFVRSPLAATEDKTLRFLRQMGCRVESWSVIDKPIKMWLETTICGRERYTCSTGVFSVALALWCGAPAVRMVGFSWMGGYHYRPEVAPRKHVEPDRRALVELQARYPGQLSGALVDDAVAA